MFINFYWKTYRNPKPVIGEADNNVEDKKHKKLSTLETETLTARQPAVIH